MTICCFCRSSLVKLQFDGSGAQSDAAFAALAALGSYNRPNKLAALHEFVRRLIDGEPKVGIQCTSRHNWMAQLIREWSTGVCRASRMSRFSCRMGQHM